MYRNVEVLRLLPDRPGRGGTKFGYHSFQQAPINDTRETFNVHIWQDSWRSDGAIIVPFQPYSYPDTEFCDNANSKVALALHGYAKFSLTSPTAGPTTEILGHNMRIYGQAFGYVWNYTTAVKQDFEPPAGFIDDNVICPADVNHPAVFCNIGNRCFIATGIDEAVIYDSSHGVPTFSSSGFPTAYPLGVDSPKFAPVIEAAGVVYAAAAYARRSSPYLSYPDPDGALFNATIPAVDTLGFTADGVTYAPGTGGPPPNTPSATSFSIGTKTAVFVTAGLTIAIALDENIATLVAGAMPAADSWVGLTLTADGKPFVILAQGNSTVPEGTLGAREFLLDRVNTGNYVGTWFFPSDDVTPPSIISGFPFSITGVRWTMTRGGPLYTWAGGLTATVNTVLGQLIDGVGGTDAGGVLGWGTNPPTYAYAWYDPITGHISNISPTFTPNVASIVDKAVRIPIDAGQISYPPNETLFPYVYPYPRFTHILFFRTLMSGGSTLYPIGSLQPSVPPGVPGLGNYLTPSEWRGLPNQYITSIPPAGTGNYWYDSSRDSDLLGSGALRAPQFTNGKPTVTQEGVSTTLFPSHMAYWDGRLWTACTQDPAAIHYSCDRVQCPFGVPEESFPDTNVLRIPASDGAVRGMKLIGESLLITTERWAYTIAGNNESNYRLVRISTRMPGVGDYQMAEFVPEVEGQTAFVVFLGTDANVYAMPLGGEATKISKDIQTYLTAARLTARTAYAAARIHTILTEGRRLVVLYCPAALGLPGKTFLYDFDTKTWSEHTLTSTTSVLTTGSKVAWATISTSTDYGSELYAQPDVGNGFTNGTVRLWQWMNTTPTTPVPYGSVRTFPLTFDGKKTRKQLHFVRIYVNHPSQLTYDGPTPIWPWRIRVRENSSTTLFTATPIVSPDFAYNMLGGSVSGGANPVDSPTAAELITTASALTVDGSPLLGYTFDIEVLFPLQVDRVYQLYAVDIGWSAVSEQQVDP